MKPDTRQQTARIYQFPVKPRRTALPLRHAIQTADAPRHAPAADFGSGWYHDAAINNEPAGPHAG